jgi:hypothetical protein
MYVFVYLHFSFTYMIVSCMYNEYTVSMCVKIGSEGGGTAVPSYAVTVLVDAFSTLTIHSKLKSV